MKKTIAEPTNASDGKQPFDINQVIEQVRLAVKPYPKAAMFELAQEGHDSVFELLVGCIISIRTRDEVTLPTARRLFTRARTPAEMAALSVEEIDTLIHDCAFHESKARQMRAIARIAVDRHGGQLPADRDALLGLHGVGPKCANLVLGIARNRSSVSTFTSTASPTAGATSARAVPSKRCALSKRRCRGTTGSRSMRCWCRSVSMCAQE